MTQSPEGNPVLSHCQHYNGSPVPIFIRPSVRPSLGRSVSECKFELILYFSQSGRLLGGLLEQQQRNNTDSLSQYAGYQRQVGPEIRHQLAIILFKRKRSAGRRSIVFAPDRGSTRWRIGLQAGRQAGRQAEHRLQTRHSMGAVLRPA